MENPNNRPIAVNLIAMTLDEWEELLYEGFIGVSRETAIYNALFNAGYLTNEATIRVGKN